MMSPSFQHLLNITKQTFGMSPSFQHLLNITKQTFGMLSMFLDEGCIQNSTPNGQVKLSNTLL